MIVIIGRVQMNQRFENKKTTKKTGKDLLLNSCHEKIHHKAPHYLNKLKMAQVGAVVDNFAFGLERIPGSPILTGKVVFLVGKFETSIV